MIIFILTLTNKKLCISVNSNVKVKTIKDKIQEAEGLPPDQQYLIFGGNKLEDKHFISDYNITENSKIHLVLKLRGGRKVIKDEPIQLKNESKKEEKRKIYYFRILYEEKDYNFSYDGNLTIKEMLTDFLNEIGSKETPEKMNIMFEGYLLNNKLYKKIQEAIPKIRTMYRIKILEQGHVIGGNK